MLNQCNVLYASPITICAPPHFPGKIACVTTQINMKTCVVRLDKRRPRFALIWADVYIKATSSQRGLMYNKQISQRSGKTCTKTYHFVVSPGTPRYTDEIWTVPVPFYFFCTSSDFPGKFVKFTGILINVFHHNTNMYIKHHIHY